MMPWFPGKASRINIESKGFIEVGEAEWVHSIEEQFPRIKEEVLGIIESRKTNPYFDKSLSNNYRGWQTLGFLFWGIPFKSNLKSCPVIASVFSQVPHLLSCSISILKPSTKIGMHRGDTDAIYRAHLGIAVPGSLPECGIQVEAEQKSWEEGKLLVFEDANNHKSWNLLSDARVVVIFDFLKSKYLGSKSKVCARVLARLVLNALVGKIGFRLPKYIYLGILRSFSFLFKVYFLFRRPGL